MEWWSKGVLVIDESVGERGEGGREKGWREAEMRRKECEVNRYR